MPDLAAKKVLRLLQPDQPLDARCAAALVLGEVAAPKDAEVATALVGLLDDDAPPVRLEAIKAVGKLKAEPALPQLLDRVHGGGAEAEAAALAAARLGAKGVKALHGLMPRVSPGLRRYIASALSAGGVSGADEAAVALLQDHDPGIVDATARTLLDQIPSLTDARRKALTADLLGLLTRKKNPAAGHAEAAVVRLLIALDDPKAAAAFWDRAGPTHPPELRAEVLRALAKWAPAPGKDQLRRLFACAADPDYRVAGLAAMMLRSLAVSEKTQPEWLALLQAPDAAARRLAVDRLAGRDTAEVAAALLEQIGHPDRALRDDALAALLKMKTGRAALADALLTAAAPDQAWALARAQAPAAKELPAALRDKLFALAGKYVEANDRRADALLFLLREADAAGLRERVEERALALRKKKDYETATEYLRLVTRDPAVGFPVRFELAGCQLRTSGKELSAEARAADPALQAFGSLWQGYEAELDEALEKAKWLEPDDLYHLGFHFAEQPDLRRRQFGGRVLGLVLKRSPKSKVAQAAKSKLKREGLG